MDAALVAFAVSFVLPLALLPVGWLAGVMVRKIRVANWHMRERNKTSWHPQYEVPDSLRPAEVAFLYDRSFGAPELLATLFDLELKGMIRLEPLPPGHQKDDFTIHLLAKGNEKILDEFEREILLSIKTIKGPVSWHMLKTDTAVWDSGIERVLEQALRQRGYFWHQGPAEQLSWLFLIVGALAAASTIVVPVVIGEGWLVRTLSSLTDPMAHFARELAMVVVGLGWFIATVLYALTAKWAYAAYRRGMDTEHGTARLGLLWPRLEGFRRYLVVVEQDKIKFENDDLQRKARVQALPYAVALNIPTNWQARFN